jgi:hypothetical protein
VEELVAFARGRLMDDSSNAPDRGEIIWLLGVVLQILRLAGDDCPGSPSGAA